MHGGDYVRSVFQEVIQEHRQRSSSQQGAFLAAALVAMQELESPLKEETLVRLVVLELEDQSTRTSVRGAYG